MKSWILVFALLVSVVHAAAPQPSAPPTIPVTVTKGGDGSIQVTIEPNDLDVARKLAAEQIDRQISNAVAHRADALVKAGGKASDDVIKAFTIEASADKQRRIDVAFGMIVQRSTDAALAKAK